MLATRFICARKSWHVDHRGEIRQRSAAVTELAKELGYLGDTKGSSKMNVWLHKEVMRQLAANGGKVPKTWMA